jgi:hypothetical protein
MSYTNPHTNTTSNVITSSLYNLGQDVSECADLLKHAHFTISIPPPVTALTFFLYNNDGTGETAKKQFNELIKLFNIEPKDIRIEHSIQRVYASKKYGQLSINIHADVKDVLEKEIVPTTKTVYTYNGILASIEDEV